MNRVAGKRWLRGLVRMVWVVSCAGALLMAHAALAADMNGGGVVLRAGTLAAGGAGALQADAAQHLAPVEATIGQAHPLESMQGGGVVLEPGFWPIVRVPEPAGALPIASALGALALLARRPRRHSGRGRGEGGRERDPQCKADREA